MNEYQLYEILQPNVTLPKENILTDLNLTGTEYDEINRRFKEGEITKGEFLTLKKELYAKEYNKFFIQYMKEWQEAEEMFDKGTSWSIWKSLFIIIQIVLIILSVLIPIYIYFNRL
ncbi:MAG: hypothetical protein ABIA78_02855 [archaeon]